MEVHQIHFGRRFTRDKKSGYWLSTDYPRIRAHQWVWKNVYGDVPKGCHIHHANHNKSDNRIENLVLLKSGCHMRLHMLDPERREESRKVVDKIRPLTKEWHGSPEGRAWHRQHAKNFNFGKIDPVIRSCDYCKKSYEAKKIVRVRFCSNACKSAFRRTVVLETITKKCLNCAKEFTSKRNLYLKYCCASCKRLHTSCC